MTSIRIGTRRVGEREPVFIIAEAGVNHNGRLDLALRLIDAAAQSGADAVKFQTFTAEEVVIGSGTMASYQKKNTGKKVSQRALLKKLELPEAWYPKLMARAKKRGIIFLSTPHGGFASVDVLKKYRVPAFKIGSGDLTNTPLITYTARLKKPMLISTGMATLQEVRTAIATLRKAGNAEIIALHTTTNYPCPPEEVNLRALTTLRSLGRLVGYSDHTEGIEASIAAVALGACVIEKHLTLDRSLSGPDHKASCEPDRLKEMVAAIRRTSAMLGTGVKGPQKGEMEARRSARKSIVSLAPIRKGEAFTKKNLGIKRPGTGLEPRSWHSLLGKRAARNIKTDALLSRSDIQK